MNTPSYFTRQPPRFRAEPPRRTGMHLVMLGTRAGPFPSLRAATSTALVVDGAVYVIDAGSGLVQRFFESGLHFGDVRGIFLTHLHSDHVADFYPFINSNFPHWRYDEQTIAVIGPDRADAGDITVPGFAAAPNTQLICPEDPTPGVIEMIDYLFAANAYDLNNAIHTVRRVADRPRDLTGTNGEGMLDIRAIPAPLQAGPDCVSPDMDPVLVYQDDRVRVSAILVEHPPVYPAWGFRFDTAYGSVTFSGDAAPNTNLAKLGSGTDILVNEVMDVESALAVFTGTELESTMTTQILEAHTPVSSGTDPRSGSQTTGVGAFAAQMGAAGLVLNHIYPDDGSISSEYLEAVAAREFGGPVHASEDLDVIDVAAFLGRNSQG